MLQVGKEYLLVIVGLEIEKSEINLEHKEELKKLKDENSKRKHHHIKFFIYFKKLLGCANDSKQSMFVNKKFEIVNKRRSVEYIFESIRELNFVRDLTLNETQGKSLKSLKKPNIFSVFNEDYVENEKNIVDYFSCDTSETDYDKILLQNFENQLKIKILENKMNKI